MKDKRQYHIGLAPGEAGRYVLLPGDPGRVPLIAQHFEKAEKIAQNREYVTYTGYLNGVKVSAVSTGIGCPSAAICLEELVRVGADTFIRVGSCGSLQDQIALGDLVISTATVRDDGTSRDYVPISYPAVADRKIVAALETAALKLGHPHHVGITHTKDAFFIEEAHLMPQMEELRRRWEIYRAANVLATAMEASALFVVASIRKVRCGEILAVYGNTFGHQPIMKKKGMEEAIQTALEAVKILAEGEK